MCDVFPSVSSRDRIFIDGDVFEVVQEGESPQVHCCVCDELILFAAPQEHLSHCKLKKPYKCDECKETFNFEINLTVHCVKTHTVKSENDVLDEKWSCPICSKSFARISGLRCHVVTHSKLDIFYCEDCMESFDYESTFKRHNRLHHERNEMSDLLMMGCAKCGECFQENELEKHRQLHIYQTQIEKANAKKSGLVIDKKKKQRDDTRRYQCQLCPKAFVRPAELERHANKHKASKQFICSKCNQLFRYKHTLLAHVKTHEAAPKFGCKLCESQFLKKSNLTRHIKEVHFAKKNDRLTAEEYTIIDFPLHGEIIEEVVEEMDDDWYHQQGTLDEKSGDAVAIDLDAVTGGDLAEQLFESRNILPEDEMSPVDRYLHVPEGSITCAACLHSFDSLELIFRHFADLCTTDVAHAECIMVCPCCSTKVAGSVFHHHMATIHKFSAPSLLSVRVFRAAKAKKHACPHCESRFVKRIDLHRHLDIHSGVRPFQCFCGDRFRLKSTLRRHEKLVHRDEENLETCSICGKSFQSRNALRAHMISHSSACNYCNLTFNSERERDSHQAQSHRTLAVASSKRTGGSILPALPGGLSTLAQISRPAQRMAISKSSSSAFARPPAKPPQPLSRSSQRDSVLPGSPTSFVHISAQPMEDVDDLSIHMSTSSNAAIAIAPTKVSREYREAGGQNVQTASGAAGGPPGPSMSPVQFAVPQRLLHGLEEENGVLLTRIEGGRVVAMHPQPTIQATNSTRSMHLRASIAPLDNSQQLEQMRAPAYAPLHLEAAGAGGCDVCEVQFTSREEAETHMNSEDHETAQFLAPLASRDTRASAFDMTQRRSDDLVCKLCSNNFAGMQQLVAHIRREHERDHPKSLAPIPHHHTAPMR